MENLYDKIESYLLKELSEADQQAFAAEVERDKALAEAVDKHRELMARLEALRVRKKVKKALMNQTQGSNTVTPIFSKGSFLLVLSGFIVLLLALLYFQQKKTIPITSPMAATEQPDTPVSTQKTAQDSPSNPDNNLAANRPVERRNQLLSLAQAYCEKPADATIRAAAGAGTPSAAKTNVQRAADAFEKGNYSLAAALLRNNAGVELDETTQFLRANAMFQVGLYLGAAQDFEALQNSFEFKHEARWNFMLCQVAQGKIDQAKPLLLAMAADPDFPFYKKALELKSKLNF